MSPENGNSGRRRSEKLPETCQVSRPLEWDTHSYLFELFSDGKPPTENSEASELVVGCESGSQAHGPTLTKPANNNPARGDTTADFLRDDLVYLVPGPQDTGFVFWALEPEAKNIKPTKRALGPEDIIT